MNALAELGVDRNGFVDAVNAKQHGVFGMSFTQGQFGRNGRGEDAARSMSVVRCEAGCIKHVVKLLTAQAVTPLTVDVAEYIQS